MNDWQCGWDIGGAHLKWALRDPHGEWLQVRQSPCALWRGIDQLEAGLREATTNWPVAPSRVRHAATMTGELVDAFPDRRTGVEAIIGCATTVFAPAAWTWFGLDGRLLDTATALADPLRLASANWLATANCAAQQGDGLLIDIGSTTTDIVVLHDGRAQPVALTDGDRLAVHELVYRGIVRTPVMALAHHVDWQGQMRPLMAEHFATSADVFRLTGDLDEAADAYPAADGGAKTPLESARRLARMLGEDLEAAPLPVWQSIARQLAAQMLDEIVAAARAVLSRQPQLQAPMVVCAGVGDWLAGRVAERLGLPAMAFAAAAGAPGVVGANAYAPALAVASLASADSHTEPS